VPVESLERRVVLTAPTPVNVSTLDFLTTGFPIGGAFVTSGMNRVTAISSAGDLNGDGLDEVVLQSSDGFFDVVRPVTGDVSSVGLRDEVGDINGDGIPDLYKFNAAGLRDGVQFGIPGTFPPFIGALNGTNGFSFNEPDLSGISGSFLAFTPLGDLNGDGFDDLMTRSGRVVFGHAGAFPAAISSSDNLEGPFVTIVDVAFALPIGDITGDGCDDLVVADETGFVGVLFGGRNLSGALSLSDVDGSNGFLLDNYVRNSFGGLANLPQVANAGDVNGDGVFDLLLGDPQADAFFVTDSGAAYVIFGRADGGFAASIDVTALTGSNGILLFTGLSNDNVGFSVASAGDVNADGYDDVIVSAPAVDTSRTGDAYVFFGHSGSFSSSQSLLFLDGNNGFRIQGETSSSDFGFDVLGDFDFNGDGFDDVAVVAPNAGTNGMAYIVYGGNFSGATVGSSGNDGLAGTVGADRIVGGRGNDFIQGLGGNDVLLGGPGRDVLRVADADFLRIDGGNGFDTLQFDSFGVKLDLTLLGDSRLQNIEAIDLTNFGADELTLTATEVVNLSDTTNTLLVTGTSVDSINFGGGWTYFGTELINGSSYVVLHSGAAVLKYSTVMRTAVSLPVAQSTTLVASGGDVIARTATGTELLRLPIGAVNNLLLQGGDFSDQLIVDFSGGNPIPVGGLLYRAGGQGFGFDELRLIGTLPSGPFDFVAYRTSGTDGGTITFDGRSIRIEQTELINDLTSAANRTFAVGDTLATSQSINVGDASPAASPVPGLIGVTPGSGNTMVFTQFRSPSRSLIVNGSNANDTITLSGLTTLGSATLSVFGGAGNDLLDASALTSRVLLSGDNGDDTLRGGSNADTLLGGANNDNLDGGGGNDELQGGTGADFALGGDGNDFISGGDGDDTLSGDAGADTIHGDADNDFVNGGSGNDVLDGGNGLDVLRGEAGNDVIHGGDQADIAFGGTGNDTLDGDNGNDTLDGEEGDDQVNGGGDADLLNGGSGNDVLDGGNGNDELHGDEGDDTLRGAFGSDTLDGGSGFDRLDGGAGNDSIRGGTENDTLLGDIGDDTLFGEDGNDSVLGASGEDMIDGGDGNDTLDGGAGNDTLVGGDDRDLIRGGTGNDSVMAGDGDDSVDGGTGNDTLLGNDGDDTLKGGAGDDSLAGGEDDDRVDGQAGNDVVQGDFGNDTLIGGAGFDTISELISVPAYTLTATSATGMGTDVLSSIEFGNFNGDDTANNINTTAFRGNVAIAAHGGNDTVTTGAGNDTIAGGEGNDVINAGEGDNGLAGGAGNDLLTAGAGRDTLIGGSGNDTLNGGNGNDICLGKQGSDSINGGGGTDTLAGGSGSGRDPGDVFVSPAAGEINEAFVFDAPWITEI
jgi:Ca2+-binding RTX toxin-like protein